eukprot:COSAG02_NODE_5063_length_4677_cov_9.641110_2_plen_269_part_00
MTGPSRCYSKITQPRVPLVQLLLPLLFAVQLLLPWLQPFAMAAPHQNTCRAAVPGPEQFTTDPDFEAAVAYLAAPLPHRVGERPSTQACLPHAQMSDQSSDGVMEALLEGARQLTEPKAVADRSTVSMPSTFPAFHLKSKEIPEEATMTPGGPTRGREFAHIHTLYKEDSNPDVISAKARGVPWQGYQGGGQGSMHLCLTLKDAASVVAGGWGETHLLAGMEMGGGMRVARGTLLVYAPRSMDEVQTVLLILQASLDFASSLSASTDA